jgi:hypothetical protein
MNNFSLNGSGEKSKNALLETKAKLIYVETKYWEAVSLNLFAISRSSANCNFSTGILIVSLMRPDEACLTSICVAKCNNIFA